MAAGLTLGRNDFAAFAPAFDAAVRERPAAIRSSRSSRPTARSNRATPTRKWPVCSSNRSGARLRRAAVPGRVHRAQPAPGRRKHLKLSLERGQQRFDAIWFGHDQSLPERIQAAYRLEQNV